MNDTKPLNTHRVGIASIALYGACIFAPVVATHYFHAAPDIVSAIKDFASFLQNVAFAGAYASRPAWV